MTIGLLSFVTLSGFPFTTNIAASALPTWGAAVARVKANTGRARIALVGDSTTMGWGAGASGYVNARVHAWPASLASGLTSRGIPSTTDNWTGFGIGIGLTFNLVHAYDPRVTFGAGWTAYTASLIWYGGGFITCSTASSTLSFTPATAFDTFDIHYVRFSTSGSFTVNIDGGTSLGTVNTSNAVTAFAKTTFSVPAGVHTINITSTSSAQLLIQGIVPYVSTSAAVDILNGGFGGAYTAEWANNSVAHTALNALRYFAPDLTIIYLGLNDMNNGTLLATSMANIQAVDNVAKLSGDVLFCVPTPGDTGPVLAAQAAYQTGINGLQATNNCSEVDWLAKYVSWASANSLGLMYDSLHPDATMYAQMGDYVASILAAVGSLDSPQFPNLLNGFAARPAAGTVAGVDYYVGCPSSTGKLVPTTGNIPAGCGLSSGVLTLPDGQNTTLDGYNLSGIVVLVHASNSGTLTMNNCWASVTNVRSDVGATMAIHITNCTLNGGGKGMDPDFQIIKVWCPLTLENSWVSEGPAASYGPKPVIRNNLFDKFGLTGGGHCNATYAIGTLTPTDTVTIQGNTYYSGPSQDGSGYPIGLGAAIALFDDGGNYYGSTITGNTMVSSFPDATSYFIGYYMNAGGTATGGVVSGNYVWSVNGFNNAGVAGAIGFYTASAGVTATVTGNINMATGGSIS